MKRSREDADDSMTSGFSMEESEKLQSVLSGRVSLDTFGFSSGNSKITLASSMDMLQSLPDSVRSCLMEAARLCAPPALKQKEAAPIQQHVPLNDGSRLLGGNNMLAGLNFDSSSLQALQKITDSMKTSSGSLEPMLPTKGLPDSLDKGDIFSSILAADFLNNSDDLPTDFGRELGSAMSNESEQWNLQGIESMLNILAPSCY